MRGIDKTEILNYRPPLFAAMALAVGIIAGAALKEIEWAAPALACVVAAAGVWCIIGKYRIPRLVFCFCFAGITAIGIFFSCTQAAPFSGFAYVEGTVAESDAEYYGYTRYVLKDASINGGKVGQKIYLETRSELETGERVGFVADIADVSPDPFDWYSASYYRNGIGYEARCDYVAVSGAEKTGLFERLDAKLEKTLYEFAGGESGAVLKGLLVGDDSGIERGTEDAIRTAGLSHVLAVSGLHVGFLCGMVYALFRLFGRPPKKAVGFLAVMLPVYGLMTGFPPGVVRAGITALVFLFSLACGRRFDALNALSLSAIVILLIQPWALFDLGFAMSFSAVAGIILFANPIRRALPQKNAFMRAVANAASVCVGANVLLFGLTASAFGTFAVYFLPANIIAVPLVSLIYSLAVPITFIAMIIPYAGYLLIPIGYLTQGFILFSEAVAALPGATAALSVPFAAALIWDFGWVFVSGINLIGKKLKGGVFAACMAAFTLLLFI